MKKKIIIYISSLIVLSLTIISINYMNSSKDYIETYVNDEKKEKTNNTGEVYTEVYTIINLNTTTKEQLMTLNGFGEKIAERVIQYRNDNGKFNAIEELMNVKGIGKEKFKKVKGYIEV